MQCVNTLTPAVRPIKKVALRPSQRAAPHPAHTSQHPTVPRADVTCSSHTRYPRLGVSLRSVSLHSPTAAAAKSAAAACSSSQSFVAAPLPAFPNGASDARTHRRRGAVTCRAGGPNEDKAGPTEYSQEARLRQEVLAPFRTVRMFLYGAFIASASVGSFITLTAIVAMLAGARGEADAQALQGAARDLAIDVGAVVGFALLYRSDARARDASMNRLTREESLAQLRLELASGRLLSLAQLRGKCRLVIVVGPRKHVQTALAAAAPYRQQLLERGVLVAPFVTADAAPAAASAAGNDSAATAAAAAAAGPLPGDFRSFARLLDETWAREVEEGKGAAAAAAAGDGAGASASASSDSSALLQRWMGRPAYTREWERWLKDQMKFANVETGAPVYLSLRLDGRVRASGLGFPPWAVISKQLPPSTGIWAGALDGMDGRVL